MSPNNPNLKLRVKYYETKNVVVPCHALLSGASNLAAVCLSHKVIAEIRTGNPITGIQILWEDSKAVLIHDGITHIRSHATRGSANSLDMVLFGTHEKLESLRMLTRMGCEVGRNRALKLCVKLTDAFQVCAVIATAGVRAPLHWDGWIISTCGRVVLRGIVVSDTCSVGTTLAVTEIAAVANTTIVIIIRKIRIATCDCVILCLFVFLEATT